AALVPPDTVGATGAGEIEAGNGAGLVRRRAPQRGRWFEEGQRTLRRHPAVDEGEGRGARARVRRGDVPATLSARSTRLHRELQNQLLPAYPGLSSVHRPQVYRRGYARRAG